MLFVVENTMEKYKMEIFIVFVFINYCKQISIYNNKHQLGHQSVRVKIIFKIRFVPDSFYKFHQSAFYILELNYVMGTERGGCQPTVIHASIANPYTIPIHNPSFLLRFNPRSHIKIRSSSHLKSFPSYCTLFTA